MKEYRQCLLRRPEGGGVAEKVAWIPSHKAEVGAVVNDGYTIAAAYEHVLPGERVSAIRWNPPSLKD